MGMTPARVAERVAGMIESIRDGCSQSFSEHNTRETLNYVAQVHGMGLINDAQRSALESAIFHCWRERQPGQNNHPSLLKEL